MLRSAELLTAGVIAVALLSALLTRLVRDVATRRGMLDVPNHRSSHAQPMPRTGGVAIAFATTIAWVVYVVLFGTPSREVLVLAVGSVVATSLGFIDDARSLGPGLKLLGQAMLAAPAVLLLPMAVPGWPLWLTSIGAIIWILAYTNMFNFMDGSDGLAAGTVVIIGGVLAMFSFSVGNHGLGWFALATTAASAGFLRYNLPPASVFMGDSGSFFLGYTIAVLCLLAINSGARPIAVLLLVYPFVFDASYTLLHRLLRGERFWRAHREHLYQQLLVAGFSHGAVAHRYYVWQLVAAACAVTYQYGSNVPRTAAVMTATVAAAAVLVKVAVAGRSSTMSVAWRHPGAARAGEEVMPLLSSDERFLMLRHVCPRCSAPVHRSKTKRLDEYVLKRLTSRRLYRCIECGWRDWMSPVDRAVSVGLGTEPTLDLSTLDGLLTAQPAAPRQSFSPNDLQ